MQNNDMPLQSIPLEKKHLGLNAKMASFGGWNMPLYYSEGILAEHHHTRSSVSLFDCSHMGQFRLTGPKVADDLDYIFPRRVGNQKINSCRYNFLLTETGTVCDDVIVYRVADDEFYIVVNAGTILGDAELIQENLTSSTRFVDESAETVKLDVQGPEAANVVFPEKNRPHEIPRYFRFAQRNLNGVSCLISRTGYTGELGFEIYSHVDSADKLWDFLIHSKNVKPAGLGARDTLRLEMGYPLYGHELSRDSTPVQAGFGRMLDLDHPFIGRENLLSKTTTNLVGIRFDGRRAVRQGALLCNSDDEEIGKVTSGSFSPSLKSSIAMGYINSEDCAEGKEIVGKVGNKNVIGSIVSLPFYQNGSVRNAVDN